MNDRIKLAEVMGWNNITDQHLDTDSNLYVLGGFPPDTRAYGVRSSLPDPFTDANDCEALIRWLNEQGWYFHIEQWDTIKREKKNTLIELYRTRLTSWKNDTWWGDFTDWKQGVCELALKVLDLDGDRLNRD